MSKMDYHFKQQKTAKPRSGNCATNIQFAHIQAQIETLIELTIDIEAIDKKSGHQSKERNKLTRRIDNDQDSTTKPAGTKTVINRYKASTDRQSTRPSWSDLGVKEGSRQEVRNLRGQKVRNPQDDVETACMGTMSKTTGAHQKVSINVSMVSLEPEYKSSELVVPERRPSRVYPKLEEQSVGGGDALPPCIPDAQQIRLPGGSPKPPVLSDKGLVDGAVSPEEPSTAEKPGNDQVSITVSMVSRGVTKERGDRHGALNYTQRGDLNGPLTKNKQRGDLYGPLTQRTTRGGRFGLPSNIYTRGDLYGSPTQKDGSRSHPHERRKRTTFKSILLLVWIILVVYIGQTSSANEERGFIIKRQGYVRLDDTHNSTARYESTDSYIPHSPCAQPM